MKKWEKIRKVRRKNDMGSVIIPRRLEFETKKHMFISGGSSQIHVLCDFDKTLTKAQYHNEKIGSLISRLRNGKYLNEEYIQKAHALFDEYHPLEIDPAIPFDTKSAKMQEWWVKHMKLLIESGLNKRTLETCVHEMMETKIPRFRKGAEEFLSLLKKNTIPLIILSASLHDLIEEFLRQKKVDYDNIHVVANKFTFDNYGTAKGIQQIIHVCNKNEATMHQLPIYTDIDRRKNILLMGDSLGDLKMAEGFLYDALLKIGFLNEDVKKNLRTYQKQFDVIIRNDGDFYFVNTLLREILHQ